MRSTLLFFALLTGVASAQDLPEGKGRDLLNKHCKGCHVLTVVTSAHKTDGEWTVTLAQMLARGSGASDDEAEIIFNYLCDHFGKDAPPPATAKIPVNTAPKNQLLSLPLMTEAEAAAIVDYRAKNGRFANADDLKKVPGLKPATLAAYKDRLAF